MKTCKTGWAALLMGLFLIAAGIIFGNSIIEGLKDAYGEVSMQKVVTEVKPEWKGGDNKIFGVDTIRELQENLRNECMTYTVRNETGYQTVNCNGSSVPAKLVGAASLFSMFHQFEFLDGSFFPMLHSGGTRKLALIREDFAWKLFKTQDAVGRTIKIYDESFKIIGVYRNPKNVIYHLAKGEMPEVLIPAETMLELDSSAYIDSVEVAAEESKFYEGSRKIVLAALRQAGVDEARLEVTDFQTCHRLMRQRPLLIVFVLGVTTILFWSLYALQTIWHMLRSIRKHFSDLDFWDGLRASIRTQGIKLIQIAVILTGIVLVTQWAAFDFCIPPEYIPGETLDSQKYVRLFKESLQTAYSGVSGQASLNIRLLQASRVLTGILFQISLFGGFILYYLGTRILRLQRVEQPMWKAGGVMGLCLGAAAGLSFICGLPVDINTKEMMMIWIFVVTGLKELNWEKNREMKGSVRIV